ncbi:hypothetical protein LOTGIDRAFT_164648 [Lottia gigantea]|uniref:Uncharacterized protein n=1 Tax=Lottia gigantea TaxID=225164 RepID=V4A9J2_LOTGI|nr:hypothetical protein LOTGIDRAFT_164648 [Lottia gigantea]ESO89951.1 hypothetical protein LOTGIDRAFT_164648 [Lottia gigantea]
MAKLKQPEKFHFDQPGEWPVWKQTFSRFRIGSKLHKEDGDIQSESCLIVDMVGPMKTLLKTFLGKFLKISSMKSAKDVTQVDYTNKDNYLPVDFLAIGMKARAVLADNQDNLEPSTLHRIYSGQD